MMFVQQPTLTTLRNCLLLEQQLHLKTLVEAVKHFVSHCNRLEYFPLHFSKAFK